MYFLLGLLTCVNDLVVDSYTGDRDALTPFCSFPRRSCRRKEK